MAVLCDFKFTSFVKIDNEEEKIEFVTKGYKNNKEDELVYYFKNDNEYKFVIKGDILVVFVNDSKYSFNMNKKTEALINNEGYCYKASISTNKLLLESNKIEIEYVIDFTSFKGEYKIILELH